MSAIVGQVGIALLFVTACGETRGDQEVAASTDDACVPNATEYASTVKPILVARCGQCHGDAPQWGAPFSLLEYAKLIEHGQRGRIVDNMVTALGGGTMPPAGQPRPTEDEFDKLVAWASCGTSNVPYTKGLTSTARPLLAPSTPPADLERIELKADEQPVPGKTIDRYVSFFFDGVVSEDKFVRRFDVILDQRTVVHHVNIHFAGDNDDRYLYAWAPGTGAFQFPEGGLRIHPSDRFRVEVHYNNLDPDRDLTDSSGIALYVAAPGGTEYEMAAPSTFSITVPAHSEATAVATCATEKDFTVLAGMPHMHVIGSAYRHDIHRADGTTDELIALSNWSFDSQLFYALPAQVHVGDEMVITCTYLNPTDTTVTGGTGTKNEMCYDFMYVTPPGGLGRCR